LVDAALKLLGRDPGDVFFFGAIKLLLQNKGDLMRAVRPLLLFLGLMICGAVLAQPQIMGGSVALMSDTVPGILNQVKARIDQLAFTPVGDSGAEFTAFVKSEITKWSNVAKESGARAD
jgi:tripartite-type tricarboxylate transporter receptor subunit TctC